MLASALITLASGTLALPLFDFAIPSFLISDPLSDDFYKSPDGLDQMTNGQIYNSRAVDPSLGGQLHLAHVAQLAYRTEDAFTNSSHTVATVYEPLIPSTDPKLLSFQVWEDSAELNCSPSYSLLKGILSPDSPTTLLDATATINFALLNGWYVVVPDHEGPNSAFLEGYTQGHCGLDGIRAALSYLNLDADTPTAMYGYSGGASATIWMTNLHESYAPEINIVGAAHGGTPVDVIEIVKYLDKATNPFSGFVVGALAGNLNAYPATKEMIWPHISHKLQNAMTTLYTPNQCILSEVVTMGFTQWHTEVDVDFFTYPPIAELLHRETLLKNVSSVPVSVPTFPRYIFHAAGDEVIPITPVEQYVQEQCDGGANIGYNSWPLNDHVTLAVTGLPSVHEFLKAAFSNTLPQVECGKAYSLI